MICSKISVKFFIFFFASVLHNISGAPDNGQGQMKRSIAATGSNGGIQNLFAPPERTRETAKEETEGPASKVLTFYDDRHQETAQFLDAKPILDTAKENEKYGNKGDQFYTIGRAIVNGYEAFANFLNKILDVPSNLGRNISTTITKTLDNVGGRLVGLSYP